MKILLTGARGFLGRHITAELLTAGHDVTGLVRSESAAHALHQQGAIPVMGDITNPSSLDAALAKAEGVIHTAFDHDFTKFTTNCESDRHLIEYMGKRLAGTGIALVVTSTTMVAEKAPGLPAREVDAPVSSERAPRAATEEAVAKALDMGANVSVVRLPQVHDRERHGLVTNLLQIAEKTGVSAYVGTGDNRWCAAHVRDVARLFRLAAEAGESGARWHAVAEGAIPFIGIASAIAQRTGSNLISLTPAEAMKHFGPFAHLVGTNAWSDATLTRELLKWVPSSATMFDDLI